ncbi:RDD family protein [Streptomyces diastatochromogenes]|uniref:RDD family protein n=1 Tax=Streptomyces diastatochromogenes TaxID=42236 RepID=UPI00365669F9
MSAPTPAPGDDRPREGYYPDPSIPGYVRYWNGASWVPGTSRPAPQDGEPLTPPPGARPAAPSVEETGPHFFDEDPQPAPSGQDQPSAWGTDPRVPADNPSQPSGHATRTDGTASIPPADDTAQDPGGTFIFRRPVPGPAAVTDDGTMTFRPGQGRQPGGAGATGPAGSGVSGTPGFGAQASGSGAASGGPGSAGPGAQASGSAAAGGPGAGGFGSGSGGPGAGAGFGAQASGPGAASGTAGPGGQASGAAAAAGFGAQGPVGAPHAGPGGSSGPAAGGLGGPGAQGPIGAPGAQSVPPARPGFGAGKAAAARAAAAQTPQAPQASAAVAPAVPQQAGTPMTSGPGGGQSSWAQQVHQLAGGADEPVAPWKPPVEDIFQAAARRQAAARPAGLGKRFAARLIDSLVIGAVTAAAAVPLGAPAVDHVQQKIDEAKLSGRTVTVWLVDGTTGTALGIVLAVLLLFGVLYEVLPTAKWGRTLGKKLCGLEVRDIEAHAPPTFGAALRRWLVYSIPGLLGIGIVGVLWCLFDRPWHQCWHDKAAHTFVAS